MAPRGSGEPAGLSPGRIAALADGVFAVAMTLLVLEFHVPSLPNDAGAEQLDAALTRMWPQLASYVAGFFVLGTLWIGHHYQFHFLRRADRILMWLNLGFLLAVAFLPFCVALLGSYWMLTTPCVLYGVTLLVSGTFLWGHWRYATWQRRLVDASLEPHIVWALEMRIAGGMAVYGLGLALAFVSPRASIVTYAMMPLLYLMPGRIDRHSAEVGREP